MKLEDFMAHVMKFYNVESPYELGIRIESVGLGISVSTTDTFLLLLDKLKKGMLHGTECHGRVSFFCLRHD